MEDKEVQELIKKGDVFIGKIMKGENGHYDLNGVFLNKWGQIFTPTVYIIGLGTLTYGFTKLNMKISNAIFNKIHQKRIMKQKAEAYDYTVEYLQKELSKIERKQQEETQGKHSKESE